jgi:exosortase A-associated hydrolase 1
MNERALLLSCEGAALVAVHHPARAECRSVGVLIVVGGPQYRVGSHRQFVLMARELAAHGYPVLRFDYRGMGDSEGDYAGFERVDTDLKAAVDGFLAAEPTIDRVVLWGLCDGASAAAMYCDRDPRVAGVVLVNGWARTPQGQARTEVREYYGRRLADPAFWKSVVSGRVNVVRSAREYVAAQWRAKRSSAAAVGEAVGFLERMRRGVAAYAGPVLVQESEHDLTAAEFADLRAGDAGWRSIVARDTVQCLRLAGADHTFSTRAALADATRALVEWLDAYVAQPGSTQMRREVAACR